MSKSPIGKITIDTLIYNDTFLPTLEQIDKNVYHFLNLDKDINGDILPNIEFECKNPEDALKFNANQKVKKKVNNE